MQTNSNNIRLAQSASALGAGILGFGIGAKWDFYIRSYALIIILFGAVIHVWGMYIMQLREATPQANAMAKLLWISAWVCLVVLVGLVIFLTITK